MLDQSINFNSLSFIMSENERLKYPTDFFDTDDKIIQESISFFKNKNSSFPNLNTSTLNSKTIYQINDPVSDVLLKRLNMTLKTVNSARQDNRNNIIKTIKKLLEECYPCSILRLDVKNFYESINLDYLVNKISNDPAYSLSTSYLLEKWSECFRNSGVQGLPRGLSLSSTLSEYYMRAFDLKVKQLDGVFYFARFVDDIIIFTTDLSGEDTFKAVSDFLPNGLVFGEKKGKKKLMYLPKFSPSPDLRLDFDYLGYNFKVHDSRKKRNVHIDISTIKKNRIKTRIVKAFLAYHDDKKISLLESRIRFLTSNFYLSNRYRSTTIRSGIFFNYLHINVISDNSSNLHRLDYFLRSLLFDKHFSYKILGKPIKLSSLEKRKLAQFSFVYGHEKKIFHRFSLLEMTTIKKCWSY